MECCGTHFAVQENKDFIEFESYLQFVFGLSPLAALCDMLAHASSSHPDPKRNQVVLLLCLCELDPMHHA